MAPTWFTMWEEDHIHQWGIIEVGLPNAFILGLFSCHTILEPQFHNEVMTNSGMLIAFRKNSSNLPLLRKVIMPSIKSRRQGHLHLNKGAPMKLVKLIMGLLIEWDVGVDNMEHIKKIYHYVWVCPLIPFSPGSCSCSSAPLCINAVHLGVHM